jgi:subtilisin family serine protease
MIPSSHGTHVASIAAGNTGVCPGSRIAAVLISLPGEDYDRRKSFYDSTRLAHAVDYLFELGKEYGLPVSINISLGTNGHSHDATSITSRWLDYELSTSGRGVCVAAGNAGQEASMQPGDWGYVLGRIHRSAELLQAESQDELFWVVVGDGIADLSENELEIWYNPGDHFAVSILPPNGEWIGPLEPGQFIENQELPGGTFVSLYNELYYPANGLNYIACYLSPFFSDQGVVGVRSGLWTVRLTARDVRDGRYHAWIERDDPRRLGRLGQQEAWSFPSFFSEHSFVDRSSVSSLACGNFIFSIANLDEANERIHPTSSQGPTRDGREKPEIAAPGTNIIAANGFSPEQPWIQMTGTSMASPYVTGVIGRMLALDPKLTAAQVAGILRRTARPLAGVDYKWNDDAGFGRLDPAACLQEVENLKRREDLTP